jgi:hypothetical protein
MVCAVAMFRTEVRSGFVGALIGLGMIPLRAYARSGHGLRLGAVAVGASCILALGAVTFTLGVPHRGIIVGRYVAILKPTQDESYRQRTQLWNRVLDDLAEHPWGHGLGSAGQVQARSARVITLGSQPIDNSYLLIAYQQGVWVAVLFSAGLLILLVGMTYRALSIPDPLRASLALASSAGLASFAFVIYTGDYFEGLFAVLPWTLAGIGAAQYGLGRAMAPTPQLSPPAARAKPAAGVAL